MSAHESIVFFGSGPVAAKSLELLAQSFTIEAVITKPKPPHHRGSFPVLDISESLGVTIHTVSNRADLSELLATNPVTSQIAVLIDFGIIVGQDVIDYFPLGIVNSHFSLLPEWRGADPISFAILSGQTKTGVSLMLVDAGMDTGKILTTKSLAVDPTDTTPSLTNKLITLSNDMLCDVLPLYISGEISPRQQPHADRATYSRKLSKQDGIIDWNKSADVIEREIRAFIEWPKSHTKLAGKEVIITEAHAAPRQPEGSKPGDIYIVEASEFGVVTGNGTLWIDKLKPAGKNEMPAKSFLAGYGSNL